jgi:hypothetical protein
MRSNSLDPHGSTTSYKDPSATEESATTNPPEQHRNRSFPIHSGKIQIPPVSQRYQTPIQWLASSAFLLWWKL